MYYYITEPLTTSAERKRIDDIKSTLSQLGIAGEFAVASPARTVAEHLELAFKKGFTTIVGVGSDALANTVASTILQHNYEKAVLGFIPLNNQQELARMIGAGSMHEICNALRARRTIGIDVVQLNDEQFCLTNANMTTNEPVRFQLAYRSVKLRGQCTDLLIDTDGTVKIWDRTYKSTHKPTGFLARLFGTTPATSENLSITSFTADQWQFATERPIPIIIAGTSATNTPLDVSYRKKALKLIVNRARIATEKEIDSSKE